MRRGIISFILLSILTVTAIAQDGYNWWDATGESYWYSLYNGNALLHSKFGIALEGRDELLNRVIAESGFARGEGRILDYPPVVLPFSAGRAEYVQSGSQQWVSSNRDETIKTSVVAWTIITLAAQAKQMERLYQIGIGQSNETRLEAMLRSVVASEAAALTHAQMRDSASGLYWDLRAADGSQTPSLSARDQYLMLWALSELTGLSESYSFYRGTASWLEVNQWSEDLYKAIINYGQQHPEWQTATPEERVLLIQALSAFAATSEDVSLLENLVNVLREEAQQLGNDVTNGSPTILKAKAVRALIAAQRITGNESFRASALELWASINSSRDNATGLFYLQPGGQGPIEYSAADVADLVGAYGAVIYGGGLEEEMAPYAQFFQQAVKASRLINSEGDEAGGNFDGDQVPGSANAGGPFGIAPVFSNRVQYDASAGQWHVTNSNFDTAGALALAAQLLWIGQRDHQTYMGPPSYGLPLSREAQFIGLQQQLAQIKASQTELTIVESLRMLLENAEAEIENLKKRMAGVASLNFAVNELDGMLDDLQQRLAAIEAKPEPNTSSVSDEQVAALEARIKALEDKAAAAEAAATSAPSRNMATDQIITIILVVLLLVTGFLAYQWVLSRARRQEE